MYSYTECPSVVRITLLTVLLNSMLWQGLAQQPIGPPAANLAFKPGWVSAKYYRIDGQDADLSAMNAKPVSLASGDFNGDGFPDMAVGYAAQDGGMVVIHLANPEAFAPRATQSLRELARGMFPPALPGNGLGNSGRSAT